MKNKEFKRIKTTSCGACVYRMTGEDIQVLLVRPSKNRDSWGVPKGHVDEGESLDACARREVLEETGITVSLEERLIDVVTSNGLVDKTVVTWLAQQTCDKTPEPVDGENVDVRWFSIDDLPKLHVYQVPLLSYASERLRRLSRV